jgi:polyribonucleotide nucleotidyltransferase
MKVGEKVQVEVTEIDQRGKLSLVPVEVVDREAAEKASGGGSDDDAPAPAEAPAFSSDEGDSGPSRAPRRRTRSGGSRNGDAPRGGGDRNS